MSFRRPVPTISLCADDRAVSEAVSQGLIFMMVIAAATGVAVASEAVIDNTRDEASFDQAVTGFEQLDEISRSFTTAGDQEAFLTASRQTVIYSRNGELVETEPTTISIEDGGEAYTVDSQPLQVRHDSYQLTYDTGLLELDRHGETSVVRSPANRSAGPDEMVTLRTLSTTGSFQGGDEQIVLVREAEPTEILSVSDSAEITVRTDHQAGWAAYLDSEPSVENVTTDTDGSQVEITAEFAQPATVYNQQLELEPADRFA